MITQEQLYEVQKMLMSISRYPWKCEKTATGEWWITAPNDSDHEFRVDYEPIYESSGTVKQLGVDGRFLAQAPAIIERMMVEIMEMRGWLPIDPAQGD